MSPWRICKICEKPMLSSTEKSKGGICKLCKLKVANRAGIILIPIPQSLLITPIETGTLEQAYLIH